MNNDFNSFIYSNISNILCYSSGKEDETESEHLGLRVLAIIAIILNVGFILLCLTRECYLNKKRMVTEKNNPKMVIYIFFIFVKHVSIKEPYTNNALSLIYFIILTI